jgi:hypothetical protein
MVNLFEAVAEYVSYRPEAVNLKTKIILRKRRHFISIFVAGKILTDFLTKCLILSQGRGRGRRQPAKQPQ